MTEGANDQVTMREAHASRHVRCTLCGVILPGWLPIPNAPHISLLLGHLSMQHPVELKPLLARMATEDLDLVAKEAFERDQA
jgi:hypothetical protein